MDYEQPNNRLKLLLLATKNNVTSLPVKQKKQEVEIPKVAVDWDKVTEVVSNPVEVPTEATELAKITSSDKLGSLLEKALKCYNDILDLETRPTDENFVAIMRIKASACEKIVGTQTKVDENVLRARNDSRLGDILDKLAASKKRLNLTVAVS